jgi:hypothetical protein
LPSRSARRAGDLSFLRRLSATIIPALSLPISLIGTLALMKALDLSLDNVSLLGITLAVGLVVDDAIVMLENIVRHVEDGMDPFQAAIVGSKEMGFTIMSISISLVAVFIPIFFMPGVIGGLFPEFAIVVSLAILVSAFVSLTLVPMLAARYIKHEREDDPALKWTAWFEHGFRWTLALYRALAGLVPRPTIRRAGRGDRHAGSDHRSLHLHSQGLLSDRGISGRFKSRRRRYRTFPTRRWWKSCRRSPTRCARIPRWRPCCTGRTRPTRHAPSSI